MAIFRHILENAVDSSCFSFKDGKFVAEASDIKGFTIDQQIYDDACDVGFGIRSAKTGKVVVYYLYNHDEDRDGDVTAWRFKPIEEHVRHNALAAKTEVIIFND
jgi:hypothetical protein